MTNRGKVPAASLSLMLTIAAIVTGGKAAHTQAASFPVLPRKVAPDRTLNAGEFVSQGALFGRGLAMGKFGFLADLEDDAILCAPKEMVNGVSAVGAGYPYHDSFLELLANARLLPTDPTPANPYEAGLSLGTLDAAIGNVLGAGHANLVFLANAHAEIPGGSENAGAVEIYDMNGTPSIPILQIRPPQDPGSTTATPAGLFGHSFAIADVDGDTIDDLIVGAAFTTEPSGTGGRNPHGRVYVFFGHAGFFATPMSYLHRWLAIKAPQMPAGSTAQFVVNGGFGYSVDADDLDGDGMAEILVGRCERSADDGRAHLFHGSWVSATLPPNPNESFEGFRIPSSPPDISSGVATEYETLVDPSPPGEELTRTPAFGWNVFMLHKDIGRPCPNGEEAAFDGLPDLAVYEEGAHWTGVTPARPSTGALFLFFNDSATQPGSLVAEASPVKLQTPSTGGVYPAGPSVGAFFGFCAAVIDWMSTTQSGSDLQARHLLVGEPDATVQLGAQGTPVPLAGRVFMFQAPFGCNDVDGNGAKACAVPQITDPNTVPDPACTCMPAGLQAGAEFGSWIAVGDYVHPVPPVPEDGGEEFIVSAWSRPVCRLGVCYGQAGQAYSFRPGVPGP